MGVQHTKAPDQEQGSQGSLPGRDDSSTETCKGTSRYPGNPPSDWCVDTEGALVSTDGGGVGVAD